MDSPQLANQQQVNTTGTPKPAVQSTDQQATEVTQRKTVSVMDLIGVDELIAASIVAASIDDGEQKEETTEQTDKQTEGKDELPSVKFTVNGTTISGQLGEIVKVPPIKILPGLTLDLSSASLMITGVNNGVAQAVAEGGGARVIITMGTASAYTQILEVPATDIILAGRDQISAEAEGTKPQAGAGTGAPDSGSISGSVGQLALILPGKETAQGKRPMGDVLVSNGGNISTDGLICTDGCSRIDDRGITTLNSIRIIAEGIFANDQQVDLSLTAPVEEKAEELATQLDEIIPTKPEEEGKTAVNLLSGDILSLLLEIFKLGPAALANKKLAAKLDSLGINNKEEEVESFKEAFKKLAKEKGLKILDQVWKDRNHFKNDKGKTSIKDWFRGLWYGTRHGILNVLQDSQKLSKYTKETIKSLESLGIPSGLLKNIDKHYSDFTKSGTDWASKKLQVPNEAQKDEEKKDKKLEAKLNIFPGLFTLTFSITPKIDLTIGGTTDITGLFDQFVFDITGSGELGVDFGIAADLGNAIIALEAAINAGATFAGGLDGANKIFEISGFTIQVVSNEGENPYAWIQGDSHLNLKVDMKLYLGLGLSAKSEVIGWGKDIVSRRFEEVLASVSLDEDVYKRGHIMSIHGWHTKNESITTAFLNGAKSEVMKLEGPAENNLGGVSDFIRSLPDRKEKLKALDEILGKLNDKMGDVSAMAFPAGGGGSNEELANEFDALRESYEAVINLSNMDIKRIDNMLVQYKNQMTVQDGQVELQNLMRKRDARIRWVNEYKQNHAEGLKYNRISRADVLRAYGMAFKEKGGGYDRTDKNKRTEEAQKQAYNANAILAYEMDRIRDKRKVRQERVDQLQAVLDENPNISAKDFMEQYRSIRGTRFFGGAKGIPRHIVENAVELGLYTPVELKQTLLTYERGRLAEKEANDLYTFINEKDVNSKQNVEKREKEAKETNTENEKTEKLENKKEFDKAFNESAYKADKKAWMSYVYSKCSVKDIMAYEEQKMVTEAGKEVDKGNRILLLSNLRELKKQYSAEKDPDKKDNILKQGRRQFQSSLLDEETRKGLFDKSNRYMTLSADKLRTQIKSIGTIETYIEHNVGKSGEQIRKLKGEDSEQHNAALTNKDNISIYEDYVKHVISTKDYGNSLFSIQSILDYETKKAKKYHKQLKTDDSSSNRKHLATHKERREFLKNRKKEIKELGKLSKDDAAQATVTALDMYFSGVRPQGYFELNAKDDNSINPDTLRADVSKASGYLEVLKDTKQTPPTREGMIQALEWYIKRDSFLNDTLKGRDKASTAVEKSKSVSTYDIYKTWDDALDTEANRDWINMDLKEVTEDNYNLDDMINYLLYKGGEDKHFSRYNQIKAQQDAGVSEDEIKEYYRSVLDGTLFAELAATDPTIVTSIILSPDEFIKFYRSEPGLKIVFARSAKHTARIEKINETPDDMESIKKLTQWYVEEEGAERLSEIMLNMALKDGRLTPTKVIEYERAKASVGSAKHNARLTSMYSVFDQVEQMDEEAKEKGQPGMSEEEKRLFLEEHIKAVYENSTNKGGAGFEKARFKNMDLRTEAIAEARTGTDELNAILEYETQRKKHWETTKKKITDKIVEMEVKKAEAKSAIEEAQQKISKIGDTLQVIRKGTTNLSDAKDALQKADQEVIIMDEINTASDEIPKLLEETQNIEDEGNAEIARLIAEGEEEEKKK